MSDFDLVSPTFDNVAYIETQDIPGLKAKVLTQLADMARSEWIRLAQKNLRTSARDYVRAIGLAEVNSDGATIELNGTLPNMWELGASGWDLRETLLKNNPKAKKNKDGKLYAFIPFRHGTPTSGTAVGGNAMPASIYAKAKKLQATKSVPGGPTEWGQALQAGLAEKAREHHKTDLYAGMYRERTTYAQATQTQYKTFRTISEAVTIGWKHPGFEARNFAEKVSEYVEKIAPAVIASQTVIVGGK